MDKMITFFKFIFHVSVLLLIIISLFPGSLLGFFIYGDLGRQPSLIVSQNNISINHFICYLYISMLGFSLYLKNNNFQKIVIGLFFLSIILEVLQFIVPNRDFEIYDLSANFIGVLAAYIIIKIYKFWSRS